MKKIFNKIYKTPVFYAFVLMTVILLPSALVAPAENVQVAIVETLGIDFENGEYEVSALSLVPVSGNNAQEKYKLVSAKANTVASAIGELELYIGKSLSLTHTSVLVVSESIAKNKMLEALDTVARTNNLGNNTIMIVSKNSKELIDLNNKNYEESGKKLSDIVLYNEELIYSTKTNLEAFYKAYLSKYGASISSKVDIKSEEGNGISVDGGQGSGGASSQSGDSEEGEQSQGTSSGGGEGSGTKKVIHNGGGAVVFKNGEMQFELSKEEVVGLNWINNQTKLGEVRVENISDETLQNASITYGVAKKTARSIVSFAGKKPKIHIELDMVLTIKEISDENMREEAYYSQKTFFSEKVENAVKNKIKTEFSVALQKLRENKSDVIGAYSKCERKNYRKFKKFLDSLEDPEDYLKYITYTMDIRAIVRS